MYLIFFMNCITCHKQKDKLTIYHSVQARLQRKSDISELYFCQRYNIKDLQRTVTLRINVHLIWFAFSEINIKQ